MPDSIDFNAIGQVLTSRYQESAIILPGPPLQILAQRAAPTIVLSVMQQTHGKFYYECKTITGGYMQIGWADSSFSAVIEEGKGAGDDLHSWAYDGYRSLKWHANQKESFGKKWHAGDVIGVAVDLDAPRQVSFSLNGESLGVAFEDIKIQGGLYPCITMLRGERVELNLGTHDNHFVHEPPSDDYSCLTITQPIERKEEGNRFSCATPVIEMGLSQYAFNISFPGEIMVNVMGRGLDYEAKKNAMIHAGYEVTLKRWEAIKDKLLPKIEGMGLTNNESHALICYTLEDPPVYKYFNNDTRKGFGGDGADFPIISHLLREGCRKLLAAQPKKSRTRIVYRGVSVKFATRIGEIIRFGSFTSTSGTKSVMDSFRRDDSGTEFFITTKIGAPIVMFSLYPEEDEVLIPPYEIFKVTNIEESTPLRIHVESKVDDGLVEEYANSGAITWNS